LRQESTSLVVGKGCKGFAKDIYYDSRVEDCFLKTRYRGVACGLSHGLVHAHEQYVGRVNNGYECPDQVGGGKGGCSKVFAGRIRRFRVREDGGDEEEKGIRPCQQRESLVTHFKAESISGIAPCMIPLNLADGSKLKFRNTENRSLGKVGSDSPTQLSEGRKTRSSRGKVMKESL